MKNEIKAKINHLSNKLDKLIVVRDAADRVMFEHENDAGTTYALASKDYFHAIDKIKTLTNMIANLEELLIKN